MSLRMLFIIVLDIFFGNDTMLTLKALYTLLDEVFKLSVCRATIIISNISELTEQFTICTERISDNIVVHI